MCKSEDKLWKFGKKIKACKQSILRCEAGNFILKWSWLNKTFNSLINIGNY